MERRMDAWCECGYRSFDQPVGDKGRGDVAAAAIDLHKLFAPCPLMKGDTNNIQTVVLDKDGKWYVQLTSKAYYVETRMDDYQISSARGGYSVLRTSYKPSVYSTGGSVVDRAYMLVHMAESGAGHYEWRRPDALLTCDRNDYDRMLTKWNTVKDAAYALCEALIQDQVTG